MLEPYFESADDRVVLYCGDAFAVMCQLPVLPLEVGA